MLCGQLASCRLIRPWRSRMSRCSLDLRERLCRSADSEIQTCCWRARVGEKRQSTGPGMMSGPVWGGRQAAGKADSQRFSGKRLPHAWVGSRPTKPGSIPLPNKETLYQRLEAHQEGCSPRSRCCSAFSPPQQTLPRGETPPPQKWKLLRALTLISKRASRGIQRLATCAASSARTSLTPSI